MKDQNPNVGSGARLRARQDFARTHVHVGSDPRQRIQRVAGALQQRLRRAGRELFRGSQVEASASLTSADTTRSARADWAPISFHTGTEPTVSDELVEHASRVYELQEQDSHRFAKAQPELLARLRPDRRATIAMNCDSRFFPLFENWAASCTQAQIETRDATLVFTTDAEAKRRVEALGYVAYFDEDSDLLASMQVSEIFGDQQWTQYMYHQNWVIKQLLRLGTDVLFQDVDLVWMRDPIDFLQRQADSGTDIQAMYDGPSPRFQPLYANSGFMYFRPTNDVHSFWEHVYAEHRMVGYYRSQQEPLNVLLTAYAHRGLNVQILDEELFTNGHRYCGGRTPPANPWVMHNSWTRDLQEKLERYRAFDLWFLD